MKEIIDELILLNIVVKMQGDQLKIEGPKEKLTPLVVEKIKSNKVQLLDYLKSVRSKEYLVSQIPTLPKNNGDGYPLSSAQKRMLLLSQLHETKGAFYNISGAYSLKGNLDIISLQKAFNALVERHEIIRTVYVKGQHGQFNQYIQDIREFDSKIVVEDFSKTDDSGERIMESLRAHMSIKFDLSSGPLLLARLFKAAEQEYVFSYTMHHINSDGWSLDNMMGELMNLYNNFSKGKSTQLTPLRIQYKDYATWQQALFNEGALDTHKNYWVKKFSGELPVLELPTDFLRPSVRSGNGSAITMLLNKDLTSKLTLLTQKSGASLFMGLTALVDALLFRYSSQKEIIIGTPVAGREHADLQGQIGFYVNMLALRIKMSGHESFNDLINIVKEVTLEAYDHQVYPFDELVDKLGLVRDISRNALFDVAVSLKNKSALSCDSGVGEVQVGEVAGMENTIGRYDLAFDFKEVDGGLLVTIEYNSDIFLRKTVERISNHIQKLLEAVLITPGQPLYILNYLGEVEYKNLRYGFNETTIDYPLNKNLLSALDEITEQYGENIAIVDLEKRIPYSSLDKLSESFAAYLTEELGLLNGDRVGLFMDKSVESIIIILGILKAKLIYVPINPTDASERINHILLDAAIKVIFTDTKYSKSLQKLITPSMRVITEVPDYKKIQSLPPAKRFSRPDVDSLAYIFYTSGSTGLPKGVMVSYKGILNIAFDHRDRLPIKPEDHVLQFIPLSFDGSILEIFMTLLSGASLVMPSFETLSDLDLFSEFINQTQVTIASFTPSYFRFLSGLEMPSVNILISAGESIDPEVAEYYYKKNKAFFNGYGPTETTVNATLYKVEVGDFTKGISIPIGKPSANKKIVIVDDNMQLLPYGVVGEICIWGNGLADGYLNQPELTAEKFIANPFEIGTRLYKTGDVGFWTPEGNIIYRGRKDNQVKIRGYRVELGEIEAALDKHGAIEKSAVLQQVNKNGEKEIVSFYVINSNNGYTAKKIVEQANNKLHKRELFELESGLSMYAVQKAELQFLYKEIISDNAYLKYGITIPDGATIFDVGANIGLFSVYANLICKDLTIYAFEPLPPNFEILELNASLYSGTLHTFPFGLSDKEERVTFTYYPYISAMSSRYIDETTATETVRQFVLNTEHENNGEFAKQGFDALLKERLKSEKYTCQLKTVSQVIRDNAIAKIDLLKIDVEQAELDVLNGIEAEDWKKIDQVVMEVHDLDGRLNMIEEMLGSRGFEIYVEQCQDLESTNMYKLYARHNRCGKASNQTIQNLRIENEFRYGLDATKRNILEFLNTRLPSYMIPVYLVAVDKFPTINEKIDRKILVEKFSLLNAKSNYVSPVSRVEHKLVEIWREVLDAKERRIGIKDNFFSLGGHSLSAMRIINKIHEHLDVDVDLSIFFNQPTIEALAIEIQNVLSFRNKDNEAVVDRRTV